MNNLLISVHTYDVRSELMEYAYLTLQRCDVSAEFLRINSTFHRGACLPYNITYRRQAQAKTHTGTQILFRRLACRASEDQLNTQARDLEVRVNYVLEYAGEASEAGKPGKQRPTAPAGIFKRITPPFLICKTSYWVKITKLIFTYKYFRSEI